MERADVDTTKQYPIHPPPMGMENGMFVGGFTPVYNAASPPAPEAQTVNNCQGGNCASSCSGGGTHPK
jgi:hypothetical protein